MYKLLPVLLFGYGLALTTEDIYDNSYALIIGIDKYQNVQNLNYAVKDAASIQDILVNTFDFPKDNVRLLTNEDATKQNIIEAFSDITTKAEESDRVLIYFAGHGETMDLPEGGEMGYLLPVDGNSNNLYVSSIGMDELKKISLMSNAKHLLYLVDACYGGLAAIGSRGLDAKTTSNFIEKITKNKSRQIITAGGRGEKVIEKSEWGHSAFTLNLNRGLKEGNADLNGDDHITANELGMFLSEKVTIDSDNQQTPQYGRMTSQEGEFVFVLNEQTMNIYLNDKTESLDAKSEAIDYNKLAHEIVKQQKVQPNNINANKLNVPQTTLELLKQMEIESYFHNKTLGLDINPVNLPFRTLSGGFSWFSKNKKNKEFSLPFYFSSKKFVLDFHQRIFTGRKEWINGEKNIVKDKKGLFFVYGVSYKYVKSDSQHLVGIALGGGSRFVIRNSFYYTPAIYFGSYLNQLEPLFKIEILKFGLVIK